jgi:tetratricopeptide (TPR) repeat protein
MPLRAAYGEKNFGLIAVRLGQVDHAIAHLLAAREAFAALGQPLNVADCTINLGIAAFYSGLFELALTSWRQTEADYTRLGIPLLVLTSRRNQGEALFRLGQLDAAAALLAELIPVAERLGARADLGEILHVLGEVRHAQGKAAQARESLLRAEALFAAMPNRPAAARAQLAQGWLALEQGDLGEAEGRFAQAGRDLEASPVYHWRATYGLGRCAERRQTPEEALGHYRRACREVAGLRSHLAQAHASSALFREARQLVDDALRLAAGQGEALGVLQIAEQQRALALQQQLQREPLILPPALQATYEARRAALRALALQGAEGPELDAALSVYLEVLLHGRHAAPPAQEAGSAAELDLDALRASLCREHGEAWTALTYVQAGETLLAVTLDAGQLQLTSITLDRPLQLMLERAYLPRYRAYTYQDLPFVSGQRASPWADLAALGERLIPAEVQARLGPEHRLLIAPGGPLHSLPWGALRVGEGWLAERAVIQLVPGLQSLAELTRRPPPGEEALLVAVDTFGGRATELTSALPSLELAARHWPGPARRLVGEAVTRAALREAAAAGELRRYGLLHLATHGQLMAGRGMLAHLKLADDDLLADEVAQLGLGGALVILAACEGALGESLPGEELVSLSRALLAGGARDVVASLWQLYDLTLLPMLEPLYAALAAGRDAPTALAEAQRACIRQGRGGGTTALGAPYVWASLCVTGAGVGGYGRRVVPGTPSAPPSRGV